jgi:aspartokinase/homoserine dehydrogenase 1
MKPQHYTVHKFGGSNLVAATDFTTVAKRLTGKNEVVVVSATRGTTAKLQHCLDVASQGESFKAGLQQLQHQHEAIIKSLLQGDDAQALLGGLQIDISQIHDVLHAISIIKNYSKQQQDNVLGFGEQWSAKILTGVLSLQSQAAYLNASTVLFTHKKHGMLCVDWVRAGSALDGFVKQTPFDQLVITGFIACDEAGKLITLGLNCSDFSAAIFAKLFQAKALIIWKDTDGIFSADPARVRSAFPLEHLSYASALELAYFGATVIHPKTIAPVMEDNIPIHIKNALNPDAKGTLISADVPASSLPIQGITSISDIALINIEGTGLIGVCSTAARVFGALAHVEISVILISQASSEHSICLAVQRDVADQAVKVLEDAFEFEIAQRQVERIEADKACAILAVVGDGMEGAVGVNSRLAATLAQANINLKAIAQGSSERNISVVVSDADIDKALRAVHAGFYLSNKTLSIGIIGPGVVGGELIQQINASLSRLHDDSQLSLQVRGICNSSKMILSDEALALSDWQMQLAQSDISMDANAFVEHVIADDIPHAVIIDCSANQGIADQYVDFVKKGGHIITPNKRAGSGDYAYYQSLKQALIKHHRHFLYETTVCAGLPVISTLGDIIQTGDEVLQIEGVVSGTISYIFSELLQGTPFSDVIIEAKRLGYTEPDPRDDLTGMDIARKVVILARELGLETTLEDVGITNLVPESLRDCDVESFLQELPKHDDAIASMIASKLKPGESPAYVGCIAEDGSVTVGIGSYPATHPFVRLQGADNILTIKTKRYFAQPLVIQGPGAGAAVTAAGVFADLLRLSSMITE